MLLHFCKTADCCLNGNFFVLSLQLFYVKNYFMFQNNLYSSFQLKNCTSLCVLLFSSLSCCSHIIFYVDFTYICRTSIFTPSYLFFVLFDCIIIILYVKTYTVIYCTKNVSVDLIKFYTQRYSCFNTSKDLMYIY